MKTLQTIVTLVFVLATFSVQAIPLSAVRGEDKPCPMAPEQEIGTPQKDCCKEMPSTTKTSSSKENDSSKKKCCCPLAGTLIGITGESNLLSFFDAPSQITLKNATPVTGFDTSLFRPPRVA